MSGKHKVDDWTAGRHLRGLAMLEIRAMARRRKPLTGWPDDDFVACIAWLADLCHNMPVVPFRTRRWWHWRDRRRPMEWTWKVAGPAGREWILTSLEKDGMNWTPPSGE
ncbi:hypothetical protein ACIGXM_03510 [Kitasatospora sp. NPDC052896]|uniref:hypothetical protein n=1 Tax=Kitasatospora sp. NPDC052896 TaxID=3364061 RepID=UPI0037C7F570